MFLDWFSTMSEGNDILANKNLFMRMYDGDIQSNDTSVTPEPPATPAHLFPIRAFRQALFGTPKPVEAPPLQLRRPRISDQTTGAHEADISKQLPKTTEEGRLHGGLLSSPSKLNGILATPGIGVQRRKTVTFEDSAHVKRRHARDDGLRYISKNIIDDASYQLDAHNICSTGHAETEELHLSSERKIGPPEGLQYCKGDYEVALQESAMRLRQAAKKERVARKYARLKDLEVQELATRLREESLKVVQLEARLEEYTKQLATAAGRTADSNDPSIHTCEPNGVNDEVGQQSHIPDLGQGLKGNKNELPEQSAWSGAKPNSDASAKPLSTSCLHRHIPGTHLVSSPSDIWINSNVTGERYSDLTKRAQIDSLHLLPKRMSCTSRSMSPDTAVRAISGFQSSALSSERREAAKRRLDEKRRSRTNIVPARSIPMESSIV